MTDIAAYTKMKRHQLEQAQRDTSLPADHREMIDLCLTKLRLQDTLSNVQKQIDALIEAHKAEESAEQEENSG
jgi:hypothetical protein